MRIANANLCGGNLAIEHHVVVTRTRQEEDDKQPFNAMNAERMMDYVKTYTYDDSGKLTGQLDNMSNFRVPFEVSYEYDNYDNGQLVPANKDRE